MDSEYIVAALSDATRRLAWESGEILDCKTVSDNYPHLAPLMPESQGLFSYKVDGKPWKDVNKLILSNPHRVNGGRFLIREFTAVTRTDKYKRVRFLDYEFAIKAEPMHDLEDRIAARLVFVFSTVPLFEFTEELNDDPDHIHIVVSDWDEDKQEKNETYVFVWGYKMLDKPSSESGMCVPVPATKWLTFHNA